MKPFSRRPCQNFALYKNITTTNVGSSPTYFVIDHFMAANYLKYWLMLLPLNNSARVSHVCCYFYKKTRGWNGCQSTKFVLMAEIWNGAREQVISLFLTAHSRVSRSSKVALATGIQAGQSMKFFSVSVIQSNQIRSETHPTLYLKGIGGILSVVNGTQYGADSSPPSKIKNNWIYVSTPSCLYVVHRNNFVFADNCKKQELDEFGHKHAKIHQLKKSSWY